MLAGFADPTLDTQRISRVVLEAMSCPGRILDVPELAGAPEPLDPAATAVCLALLDLETALWLDAPAATPEVLGHLRFYCGCPIVDAPAAARFALITDPSAMPPLDGFDAGSDEFHDRSATLIVQVPRLRSGVGRRITGPGVESETFLEVGGLPARFWADWNQNHARSPRGVDMILSVGAQIAGLPRTARVEG